MKKSAPPAGRTQLRTPNNDTAGVTPAPARPRLALRDGTEPVRTCILSREESPREGLIRLVLAPDGQVLPDVRAKAPGRGAWIGVDKAALAAAIAKGKLKGALSRAFRTGELAIPVDLPDRIATALERAFLDRLGLEARAGALATGTERIETAARQGKLHLLLHAADAGADGSARLAQAWRVGTDREGSGLKGLTLPVGRAILSLALGRENVVHAGLIDARAAERVSETLDRWLRFIGPEPLSAPCETGSQGASALPGGPRTNLNAEGF